MFQDSQGSVEVFENTNNRVMLLYVFLCLLQCIFRVESTWGRKILCKIYFKRSALNIIKRLREIMSTYSYHTWKINWNMVIFITIYYYTSTLLHIQAKKGGFQRIYLSTEAPVMLQLRHVLVWMDNMWKAWDTLTCTSCLARKRTLWVGRNQVFHLLHCTDILCLQLGHMSRSPVREVKRK